ncbi:hypothetical protein AMAG_13120 [Allomyces macrogynus ATCC 38327]|uniref:SET domain-containing protein n=1 Tax=Allomyces macrogynus (strain ATCC 38327) TaxID=578462 RepID=A0A0L0SZZ7_ALLM3|nr:hypothetical protein AMAG_13120 [Allomyces macrogynus ATCC 38327]|eukprot:KNE67934.1 hypothetical protein AMAG_13120 [Allomyces macrogynus ATCC 38327]
MYQSIKTLFDAVAALPGAQLSGVTVAPSRFGGNGLFSTSSGASSSVKDGEGNASVARIPANAVLTACKIADWARDHDEPLANALSVLTADAPARSWSSHVERIVFLAFLLRYARPDASVPALPPYDRAYLDALPGPDAVLTPVSWTEHELEGLLSGSAIPTLVHAKRGRLVKEFAAVAGAFDVQLPATLADFQWVDAVFWTRVLQVPLTTHGTELAMIPILDFANHSFDPTLRWERAENGDIVLVPLAPPLAPNTELFISYDMEKGNEELLFAHGFCIRGNARGLVSVPVAHPVQSLASDNPMLAARVQWAVTHAGVKLLLRVVADPATVPPEDRLDALQHMLDTPSLTLALVIALEDERDDLEAIARVDEKAPPPVDPHRLVKYLVDHARVFPDVVDRACEFVATVCGMFISDVMSVRWTPVAEEKDTVQVEARAMGVDPVSGEPVVQEVVQFTARRAVVEAAQVYRDQVLETLGRVVERFADEGDAEA